VLLPLSAPTDVPGWVQSRPFLLAGALRWLNIHRRHRFLFPTCIALLLAGGALLAVPVAGHALEIVAQYPFAPFVSLAAACAISTARRKARVHRSLADSWLAPLAAPASIAPRVLLAPVLQLSLLSLAVAIALLAGSLSRSGAVTLWSVLGAAYVAGSIAGWFSRHDGAGSAPGFHYVIVRRARENWAQAPGLEPLSYWAVGQARVFAKPKVTAIALVFVLLGVPLDMGGEKALAIAAAAWVLLYVVSLAVAAVRVAFKAARWLAPTTIRYPRFTGVLGYRVLLAQLWTCAWVLFLTYAAALQGMLRLAVPVAVLSLLLSGVVIAAAGWFAMRSAGMRSR
jgi:hypothetical protein